MTINKKGYSTFDHRKQKGYSTFDDTGDARSGLFRIVSLLQTLTNRSQREVLEILEEGWPYGSDPAGDWQTVSPADTP